MEGLLRRNIERTLGQPITDDVYQAFQQCVFEKSFDKKHLLGEEGITCKYIYFIEQGACYSYIFDKKEEKHALQFSLEGYWISDLYSFFSDRKGIYNIETLEPVRALLLNKQ